MRAIYASTASKLRYNEEYWYVTLHNRRTVPLDLVQFVSECVEHTAVTSLVSCPPWSCCQSRLFH